MSTRAITSASPTVDGATPELRLYRINLMRVGFLVMGGGLAVVKWPLLLHVSSQPLYEGVVTCMLTAMSLLALLGLRYPIKLLPILVFEALWKLIWLSLVALPVLRLGRVDDATSAVIVNCSVVVVILAVTPWGYVWQRYAAARGDRWLGSPGT